MSGAVDTIWTLGSELGLVPDADLLSQFPAPARKLLSAWLTTPADGCGHVTDILIRLGGGRRAVCAPCALELGFAELADRCGRCSTGLADDPDALRAIFSAVGAVWMVGMCSTCASGAPPTDLQEGTP